jgi:hypothetical protein
MKNCIVRIVCAAMASFLLARTAAAGPVTFVAGKTAHFVHKASRKIDEHLIEPARRVIVNHTSPPQARRPHRSS